MKLYKYLSEERICIDLQSQKKDDAIVEVAELLKDHPGVADFEGFLKGVFARERESTTGIGEGMAIPHARSDSVKDFVAAVGRSRSGIDFDAIDDQPVHLVIMMGIPTAKVKAYLKLLAHLSLLLKQKDFQQRVLEAPDAAALLKAFEEYES